MAARQAYGSQQKQHQCGGMSPIAESLGCRQGISKYSMDDTVLPCSGYEHDQPRKTHHFLQEDAEDRRSGFEHENKSDC